MLSLSLSGCLPFNNSIPLSEMNWYYASNGEQHGPVDHTALEALVAQGTVTGDTLVWREGMAQWSPYSQMQSQPEHLSNAGSVPGIICSRCGLAYSDDEVIELNGRPVCAKCKPTALQSLREGAPTVYESEIIRRQYLNHEASVKSVGILYILGGAGLFVAGAFMGLTGGGAQTPDVGLIVFMAVLFGCFGGLQLWAGLGLRRLRQPARTAAALISGIGLLGFPLGTLINGYILYLLFSKKGQFIFSDGYQRVIADTPHIKYRTSLVVWIIVGVLLVAIGSGVLIAVLRG